MKQSGYAKRQQVSRRILQDATRQTYEQFMIDMMSLTLNDPEIMGKDVFGGGRLKKVLNGWLKKYNTYLPALTVNAEADYCREKLDERLLEIFGEADFMPFSERYDYLKDPKTGKG